MRISVSHKGGYSPQDMILEAETSKSKFEIVPAKISPVEYFLSGAVACSLTDMVLLPKNQGFEIENLSIEAEAIRAETHPKKLLEVHLVYKFTSSADEVTAKRWVLSTLETYCSTLNTIRGVTKIFYSIEYNGEYIAEKEEIFSGENSYQQLSTENIAEIGSACES